MPRPTFEPGHTAAPQRWHLASTGWASGLAELCLPVEEGVPTRPGRALRDAQGTERECTSKPGHVSGVGGFCFICKALCADKCHSFTGVLHAHGSETRGSSHVTWHLRTPHCCPSAGAHCSALLQHSVGWLRAGKSWACDLGKRAQPCSVLGSLPRAASIWLHIWLEVHR